MTQTHPPAGPQTPPPPPGPKQGATALMYPGDPAQDPPPQPKPGTPQPPYRYRLTGPDTGPIDSDPSPKPPPPSRWPSRLLAAAGFVLAFAASGWLIKYGHWA